MITDLSRKALLGETSEEKASIFDVLLIILMLILIVNIFVQTFWLSPVKVDGTSMNQTLQNEDWLYMDKLAKPQRGDIVVFKISDTVSYVKRIIALPGDSIKTVGGNVMLKKGKNATWQILDEPYAYFDPQKPQGTYNPYNGNDIPEITLGEGEMFVLGDNRWGSRDSREIGKVQMDRILGVVPKWAVENKEKYSSYLEFVERTNLKIRHLFMKIKEN